MRWSKIKDQRSIHRLIHPFVKWHFFVAYIRNVFESLSLTMRRCNQKHLLTKLARGGVFKSTHSPWGDVFKSISLTKKRCLWKHSLTIRRCIQKHPLTMRRCMQPRTGAAAKQRLAIRHATENLETARSLKFRPKMWFEYFPQKSCKYLEGRRKI